MTEIIFAINKLTFVLAIDTIAVIVAAFFAVLAITSAIRARRDP